MSNDTQDAIAAFLAKGGKVQKLDTNASNNITGGQWYKASQGQVDLNKKLANGPLPEKKKKTAKPARQGEVFFHDAFRRSN